MLLARPCTWGVVWVVQKLFLHFLCIHDLSTCRLLKNGQSKTRCVYFCSYSLKYSNASKLINGRNSIWMTAKDFTSHKVLWSLRMSHPSRQMRKICEFVHLHICTFAHLRICTFVHLCINILVTLHFCRIQHPKSKAYIKLRKTFSNFKIWSKFFTIPLLNFALTSRGWERLGDAVISSMGLFWEWG